MTPSELDWSPVDALARRAAAEHGLPSLAVAVVHGGRLLHVSRVGAMPAGTRVAFRLASLTKSFTAAALLSLRDAGALRLDDAAADHLPELAALQQPTADGPVLSLRHLLSMGAGLAPDSPWADRRLADPTLDIGGQVQDGVRFAAAPGTALAYSNLGYVWLGEVIRRVAGEPCDRYIARTLVEPLGLAHTAWSADRLPRGTAIASPFGLQEGRVRPEPDAPAAHGAFAAMGGLWSTVEDLAVWIDHLAAGFPARDGAECGPLRRSTRRELQQLQRASDVPRCRLDAAGQVVEVELGYGFGVRVAHHVRLGPSVSHGGGLPGYGAHMRWLPQRHVGVVALANLTYAPLAELTRDIVDAFPTDAFPISAAVAPPALAAAAHALAALLQAWDPERAQRVLAENAEADLAFAQRKAAAAALVARCGTPLVVRRVVALNGSEADIELSGPRARATVEFQLAPVGPGRIQWYEIVDPPDTAAPPH